MTKTRRFGEDEDFESRAKSFLVPEEAESIQKTLERFTKQQGINICIMATEEPQPSANKSEVHFACVGPQGGISGLTKSHFLARLLYDMFESAGKSTEEFMKHMRETEGVDIPPLETWQVVMSIDGIIQDMVLSAAIAVFGKDAEKYFMRKRAETVMARAQSERFMDDLAGGKQHDPSKLQAASVTVPEGMTEEQERELQAEVMAAIQAVCAKHGARVGFQKKGKAQDEPRDEQGSIN